MAFIGFPRRVRFTPVPNPIFGLLLEQIDDLAELKCTLRVIWLLSQKKGYPRFLTLAEMEADRTLLVALATTGVQVETALARAVDRGTLVGVVADRHAEPAHQIFSGAATHAVADQVYNRRHPSGSPRVG